MRRISGSKARPKVRDRGDEIADYANRQAPPLRATCNALRTLIDSAMPGATSKVWHGSPVWFIDGNPVVGYNATARGVSLLFWNGQAFDEPDLTPVGKYGAAQAVFAAADAIGAVLVRRWLKKARTQVFDSKAFFSKLRAERRAGR